MSKRLEILKNSLIKKEKQFDDKLQNHMETVKQSNGQPLNDKRNGQSTLNKWDRQNESLLNLQNSIKKTKDAIEREEYKIINIEQVNKIIPVEISELVKKGELIQWKKHPNTFFVTNVKKARIVWDNKRKKVAHRYSKLITEPEQRAKFARLYNKLYAILNVK